MITKRITRTTLWIILGLALAVTGGAVAQVDTGTLTVDVTEDWGAISPYVYGASYGPWAMVSPEMAPLAAESGITFLRFPGGNWGDIYDIDPFQIDLYMIQARAWGAQLSISTRVRGGSPEKSAELVQYTNVEKDYDIRYWSIGNEPTLYYLADEGWSLERFNREWREQAEAMLAVDPDIVLLGPEVHQYPSTENYAEYLDEMRVWVRSFLQANGDLVDVVSIHRYPFPLGVNTSATTDDLRANAAETDTMIEILRRDIQEVMGHDMPIAITEMNSHYSNTAGGEASPDSFYNAIWWADVLGRLIRSKVEYVSYFALAASVGSGHGMLARFEPRPTYFVYPLYKQFGSQLVASAAPDDDVTIYASLRDDGALTLMVINLSPDEATRALELTGFTPAGEAEVWRLDAEHNAEQIDPVDVTAGLTVPGQSVTLYIIPAG
jgi:hypothetical protein